MKLQEKPQVAHKNTAVSDDDDNPRRMSAAALPQFPNILDLCEGFSGRRGKRSSPRADQSGVLELVDKQPTDIAEAAGAMAARPEAEAPDAKSQDEPQDDGKEERQRVARENAYLRLEVEEAAKTRRRKERREQQSLELQSAQEQAALREAALLQQLEQAAKREDALRQDLEREREKRERLEQENRRLERGKADTTWQSQNGPEAALAAGMFRLQRMEDSALLHQGGFLHCSFFAVASALRHGLEGKYEFPMLAADLATAIYNKAITPGAVWPNELARLVNEAGGLTSLRCGSRIMDVTIRVYLCTSPATIRTAVRRAAPFSPIVAVGRLADGSTHSAHAVKWPYSGPNLLLCRNSHGHGDAHWALEDNEVAAAYWIEPVAVNHWVPSVGRQATSERARETTEWAAISPKSGWTEVVGRLHVGPRKHLTSLRRLAEQSHRGRWVRNHWIRVTQTLLDTLPG